MTRTAQGYPFESSRVSVFLRILWVSGIPMLRAGTEYPCYHLLFRVQS